MPISFFYLIRRDMKSGKSKNEVVRLYKSTVSILKTCAVKFSRLWFTQTICLSVDRICVNSFKFVIISGQNTIFIADSKLSMRQQEFCYKKLINSFL